MSATIANMLANISGVLLTATCLVTEMCELNPEVVSHFRRVSNCLLCSMKAAAFTSKSNHWIHKIHTFRIFVHLTLARFVSLPY